MDLLSNKQHLPHRIISLDTRVRNASGHSRDVQYILPPPNSGVSVVEQLASEVTVLFTGHVMLQRWLTAGLESGPWPNVEEYPASLISESTEK